MFDQITTRFEKLTGDVTAATNDATTALSAVAAKAGDAAAAQNARLAEFVGPVAETVADNYEQATNVVFDVVLDVNRRVVDATVTGTERLRDVVGERIDVDASFLGTALTPADAGARYVDFVERAVAVNRTWNERVVEMIRANPVTQPAATKPVARTAAATTTAPKRPAAKKSVAKKSAAKKSAAKRSVAKKTAATKAAARRSAT